MNRLQDVTKFRVMSFKEAVKELGWSLEDDNESFRCTCDCGNSSITYGGFFGTEVIECENCSKRMIDLFSPIQTGNSTCAVLSPNDYEIDKDEEGSDRYWVADDGKDGIKLG